MQNMNSYSDIVTCKCVRTGFTWSTIFTCRLMRDFMVQRGDTFFLGGVMTSLMLKFRDHGGHVTHFL